MHVGLRWQCDWFHFRTASGLDHVPESPYDPTGKPDPFVSFVKIREYEIMQAAKKAKLQKRASTPLETVDVHTLKLIGIINKDRGNSLAMVELPDGKGYLIRPGMTVGLYDGVVTSIEKEMMVVEEDIIDVFGEPKKEQSIYGCGKRRSSGL